MANIIKPSWCAVPVDPSTIGDPGIYRGQLIEEWDHRCIRQLWQCDHTHHSRDEALACAISRHAGVGTGPAV